MTNISTIGQFNRIQAEMLRTQDRLLDLQVQSTTGKKGVGYGDLASDARRSLNVRATSEQLQQFKANIDTVEKRSGVADTALRRIGDLLNEIRNEYAKVQGNLNDKTVTGGTGLGFLNELGRRGLKELSDLLNTKVEDRYLFAGNDIGTPPVDTTSVVNVFKSRADTLIANYRAGVQTGAQVVADFDAALEDPARAYNPAPPIFPAAPAGTAAPVFNGSLFYSGTPTKARVDSNYDVEYGIRADQDVFKDMFKAFAIAASVQFDPAADAARENDYRTILSRGQSLVLQSIPDLNDEIGKLGLTRRQVEAIKQKHDDVDTYLQREIGVVEDADLATVFTKVQQTQVALQATFRITAGLQDLSLLNYLR